MSKTFKAGDRVYCPLLGTEIYSVQARRADDYPLRIEGENFTSEGLYFGSTSCMSHMVLANEQNHKALEALYGVEFEAPAKTGSDRVRELLAENPNRAVLCGCSNSSDAYARYNGLVIVVDWDGGVFKTSAGASWNYAVPIDESELRPQELYTGS